MPTWLPQSGKSKFGKQFGRHGSKDTDPWRTDHCGIFYARPVCWMWGLTTANTSKSTLTVQNFSVSSVMRNNNWVFSFSNSWEFLPAEVELHIFQDLNKHHLEFHALVWLHEQRGSATGFCLPLVDRHYPVKELRILFQVQICPSRASSPCYTTWSAVLDAAHSNYMLSNS